jgi:hypothetical protein
MFSGKTYASQKQRLETKVVPKSENYNVSV